MSSKSRTTITDLDRGIVAHAADAARVAEVMRLLPMVLLHYDPRAQAAYEAWAARIAGWGRRCETVPIDAALDWAILEDVASLNALVRDLGLARYQWLPSLLRWEFQRIAEQTARGGTAQLEISLPANLPWVTRGRQRDSLERNVMWYYRRKVKQPADLMSQLAREYVEARRAAGISRTDDAESVIRDGIQRIEQLLACVNAPLPE